MLWTELVAIYITFLKKKEKQTVCLWLSPENLTEKKWLYFATFIASIKIKKAKQKGVEKCSLWSKKVYLTIREKTIVKDFVTVTIEA